MVPGQAKVTEANIWNLKQRYAAEVRGTDAALGNFFDQLKAMDRWDDTLIWVLADHGEAFGEHDATGHTGNPYFEELIRIPFIIKPPVSMSFTPRNVDVPVSLYDVLPTLVSVLGIQSENVMLGRDLTPIIAGVDQAETVFSGDHHMRVAIKWPWKLKMEKPVWLQGNTGMRDFRPVSLYKLDDDPLERQNLVDNEPKVVAELFAELHAREKRLRSVAIDTFAKDMAPELREKLRSLGYIE